MLIAFYGFLSVKKFESLLWGAFANPTVDLARIKIKISSSIAQTYM